MTKNFINERFPTDISFGSVGGPEFLTDVLKAQNGFETRLMRRPYPKNRYNIAYAIKSQKQLDDVRSFFYITKGRACGFLFKDHLDYQADQVLLGKGDGKIESFQLIKRYQLGKTFFERPISKPILSILKISVGKEETKDYKVDDKGLVTFSKAPPQDALIDASFEFDVPVRFDIDYLPIRLDGHGYVSVTDIPLVEI
jgi:uncharacterized protein (TIGR02217 family)